MYHQNTNLPHVPPSLAVSKGAEFLDQAKPGWWWHVNTDTLALSSCYRCVLGQLFSEYEDGLEALCPGGAEDPREANAWAREHGFNACQGDDYAVLDQRWREAIILRRRAQVQEGEQAIRGLFH